MVYIYFLNYMYTKTHTHTLTPPKPDGIKNCSCFVTQFNSGKICIFFSGRVSFHRRLLMSSLAHKTQTHKTNLNFGHEHEKATFPLNRLQNGRRLIGSVFYFVCRVLCSISGSTLDDFDPQNGRHISSISFPQKPHNYLAKQIFKRNCYTIIIKTPIPIIRFAVWHKINYYFIFFMVGWTEIRIIRFNQAAAMRFSALNN